jgi:hypothetical protein
LGKITSLNGSQVSNQVFCMLNLCLFWFLCGGVL